MSKWFRFLTENYVKVCEDKQEKSKR